MKVLKGDEIDLQYLEINVILAKDRVQWKKRNHISRLNGEMRIHMVELT